MLLDGNISNLPSSKWGGRGGAYVVDSVFDISTKDSANDISLYSGLEVSYLPLRTVHTIFDLALIFVSCDTILNTPYVHVGKDWDF